jgi:hypothetical protein
MKFGWFAVVLMVAACSAGTTPVSTVSQSPSSMPSPSRAPAVSPSSSPSSTSAANLSCRLPVTWYVPGGNSLVRRAGFLAFPSKTLREDPAAHADSTFYDRAFAKWLPTSRQAVSPDGTHYVYIEGDLLKNAGGKVHVVDVRTGADSVVYTGRTIFTVVDFAAEGIYLAEALWEATPRGLWLLSPSGGTPRLINQTITGPVVGNGAAWGTDFNAADPKPAPGGIEAPRNRILRYDLRTGAATPFYYRPGTDLYLMGTDPAGGLYVDAQAAERSEVWHVRSTTVATTLYTSAQVRIGLAAIDSHGVWFAGQVSDRGGVWLYRNGSLEMITAVDVQQFSIAGGCIP